MKRKIALVANTAWYIANFRLSLARSLQSMGYEIVAIAPPDEHVRRIDAAGIRFIPLAMDNKGSNPFRDIGFFYRLFVLLLRERPTVYLGYTIKPNVYGGLICLLCGIPSVHNISGLGTAFIHDNWLTRLVESLYRIGLQKATKVFFQNKDDLDLFVKGGLVPAARVERLPGSGVDVKKFAPVHRAADDKRSFRFLLPARLLWDKGVGEFIEAARRLLESGVDAEFQMLGFLDVKNRTDVPRSEVEKWEREGIVRFLGSVDDVRPVLAQADCVVLPSYREGTPRSLLEAASMGLPIITTDTAGCRDVVEDGVTGFLCRVKDAQDLANKMIMMMQLPAEERRAMGLLGREKMVREFDETIVINSYLKTIREIEEVSFAA